MHSLIELETFISVGEQAERMAKVSFSDEKSDSYKTAFVAHFKSLLRTKTYDFASEFLSDMAHDLNTWKEKDPQYAIGPFFEFAYIKQFLKHLPSELQYALELSKVSHGGARKGSGRKKKEPSIQVRLPESIAGFCYGIRDEYDSMDDEGKKRVIDALESVLKASQTHFKDNIPF
ncbi:hypothetical protein [Vibrio parahaemolyticus]|uniref:hypothetical protein n=1 Tax=Vibrio parahaemolyticus TaxID=670 RepID=UPI00111FBB00|nr:hypothetical protein [Vibrio parahaemolyticus]TOK50303.1 hypothetical protein CGI17_24545 [Vibrio parahaemolyticus]TOK79611.1 hypothetical protein CGI10_24505 [Vibrio parahaemolyticus]